MNRVFIHEIDNEYLSGVEEEPGVVLFRRENELLYVLETVNLRRTIHMLYALQNEDLEVRELFSKAQTLQPQICKSATDALIQKKLILEKQKPQYNQSINIWKNYVYLAINPAEFPFVKITEYTDEDWFYIGPFRSRFFLNDVIELINKLLKLPHCEVKFGPCEKYYNNRCQGWCALIKAEASQDKEENPETPQLEKLDALLKEAYVHPDNSLLDMILHEKQKYENDLEFIKADLLKPEVELLKRYKDWLIFLYKIKNLNYVTEKVSVKNGQLVHFKADGKECDNPFVKIPYRANEVLAINKNLVDEARILYLERV